VPRPKKFTVDELLDAARDAIAEHGRAVTLAQIAEQAGAPMGSIYHRFASREELLGRLWLRSIGRFHEVILAMSDTVASPHDALVEMAVGVSTYSRSHPSEALAMTLFRQNILATTGPKTLRDEAAHINDAFFARLASLTQARYGRCDEALLALVGSAVIELSYGLVRPHVGQPIPQRLDPIIRQATSAVLDLPDL